MLGTVGVVGLPVAVAIVASFLLWQWLAPKPIAHGMVLQSPSMLSNFTLESSLGQPVSLHDYSSQYLLVTFGYTSCPDVCPLTLSTIATALNQIGDSADLVTVLFVTVDPERDTAERLASYLPHFHEKMVGLTGELDQIQAVATELGVFFEQRAATGPQSQFFDHTATIMVIDPDGYLRVFFPSSISGEELAEDLAVLVR